MNGDEPIVVRLQDAAIPAGAPTPGIERRELLDHEDRWIGWARTTPGMAGGWHHHGDRDTYVFMTRGSMTFEFGPGGRQRVTCSAGDFAFVPAGVVHREITGSDEPGEAFLIRIGTGPHNVNVDGPDEVIA